MTFERLKVLIEAYGGDPARWPPAERAAAEALLAASPDAKRLLEEAAALDRLIDAAETQPVSRALEDRILAQLPASRASGGGFLAQIAARLPFGWAPASALACSLALGLAVGTILPEVAGLGEAQSADAALLAFGGTDADFWDDMGDGI